MAAMTELLVLVEMEFERLVMMTELLPTEMVTQLVQPGYRLVEKVLTMVTLAEMLPVMVMLLAQLG